jgi:hypothetical protein
MEAVSLWPWAVVLMLLGANVSRALRLYAKMEWAVAEFTGHRA